MSQDLAITLGMDAIKIAMFLGAPILIAALVIGVGISFLQAITQINEATLSFIPKVVGIVIVAAICAPWMMDLITNYTTELINSVPSIIKMK